VTVMRLKNKLLLDGETSLMVVRRYGAVPCIAKGAFVTRGFRGVAALRCGRCGSLNFNFM
jgi:hypothetical protein